MEPFKWTCPYCNHDTTITEQNIKISEEILNIKSKYGCIKAIIKFIICPNPECMEVALYFKLYNTKLVYDGMGTVWDTGKLIKSWTLMPNSEAKVFPDYVPKAIIEDYNEACLIRDLSPKASATLSRRCLQGIIRDFWGVSKDRLIDEINAIKDKIDPLTWGAINAVRKIGNIGAHMEKDINQIIDVEPNEAGLLIQLIEILIKDWYINKHERGLRLQSIIAIQVKKESEKKMQPEVAISK